MASWPSRIVRLDILPLSAFSALCQIVYLWLLPISIEGDGAGYHLAARFFVGDPHGIYSYFHPPGYPLFLLATGAVWLKSLYLTIAVQALMGALAPLLVFGALRDVSRRGALVAAVLLALSGVPYSYAKEFLSDQLHMFCILVMIFGVSRFIAGGRAGFAVLALAGGTFAILVRNEALYLTLLAFLVMAFSAWPRRRPRYILAASGAAALALILAWSAERAAIMGNPALIGALNNYYGHTLFYRVYVTLPPDLRFWDCVVARPPAHGCSDGKVTITPLVEPENGPASHDFAALIAEWASSDSRAQFPDRTPQQLVADFFAQPTEGGPFDRFGLANWLTVSRLGYVGSDDLLRRVALEAIRAHPAALFMMAASAAPYFGVSFQNIAYYFRYWRSFGPVVFANWQHDGYETQPFNPDLVRPALLPELWREYRESWQKPAPPLEGRLLGIGQAAHNLVRNAVGLFLLLTWPALGWARSRLLSLYLLGSLGLMLATYAVSAGYSMRFEHVMLPVMIMISTIAAHTLILRLRWRGQGMATTDRGAGTLPAARS